MLLCRYSFFALFFLVACIPAPSYSHPGKVDAWGGHFHKTSQTYHCHNEQCSARHKQSEEALQEAKQEKRAFSSLYNRDDWSHWSDEDNDCQNTRSEILIKSSSIAVTFTDNNPCRSVKSGRWLDPYTNRIFTQAQQLQIDHRIALAEAHRYGGANWSRQKKEQFANDPMNLVAVQGDANQAKKAHPAHEWMPKNIQHWCDYIQQREAVVKKYRLQFPSKELTFNHTIKQRYCGK